MQMLERSSTKFLILQKEKPKLREGKWQWGVGEIMVMIMKI